MIRVLIVDDHAAVRAGLTAILRSEPGLRPVAAVASAGEALRELARAEPDVLLADYDLPDSDGLTLCWEAKALPQPPRVLVYSAFVRPRLTVAATLAGADATLDKSAPPEELVELIRRVARGRGGLPAIPPEAIRRCASELDQRDIPLFGMAMNRMQVAEIAAVAGYDVETTRSRLRALIGRLQQAPEASVA
jgi:DNA-binding NarL/FixJ family response regulator